MPAFQVPSMQLMTKMSLPQDKIGVKTEVSFIIVFPDKSEQVFFFYICTGTMYPMNETNKKLFKTMHNLSCDKGIEFQFWLRHSGNSL